SWFKWNSKNVYSRCRRARPQVEGPGDGEGIVFLTVNNRPDCRSTPQPAHLRIPILTIDLSPEISFSRIRRMTQIDFQAPGHAASPRLTDTALPCQVGQWDLTALAAEGSWSRIYR